MILKYCAILNLLNYNSIFNYLLIIFTGSAILTLSCAQNARLGRLHSHGLRKSIVSQYRPYSSHWALGYPDSHPVQAPTM